MWFQSLAPCQSYKGYVSRISRLGSVSRVHWAGLSAPFSNHSCLVVFMQRTPGSHSTGLLSVSSSPPALELLLPAPVYSALLSKPHLHNPTQQLITEKKSQELKWLWCFWPIWGCWKINKNRVGCLGCSRPKCPRDVTVSVLWVVLIQLIFDIFKIKY